ncbi:LysM peptidoglycan-binding domain-containing protein [Roseateles chitinivorans]|uniref:LysM peptidoglycan-binding domain-containing protein n=1 Tax=Roseateles chitinivorans TaxID=2917965 RepID=UPI003D67596B
MSTTLRSDAPISLTPTAQAARGRGHSTLSVGTALLLSVALAACVTPKPPPPPPEPVVTAPPPPPPPPPEPVPPTAAEQALSQKTAMQAIELLEAGQEDQARNELQRALQLDPANKLANNLMRQITVDPVQQLGRESFAYTVQSSDTLSRIAGRFMGDIYSFYILARYNDIRVPRQVSGGQVLRIPGKPPAGPLYPRPSARPDPKANAAAAAAAAAQAPTPPATTTVAAAPTPAAPPAPPPPPELSPGEKAMRAGDAHDRAGRFDKALEEYRRAEAADQPGAGAKIEAVRKKQIAKATLNARTAFAKQDLAGAIKGWDNVLQLDPDNELAKLERQKAVTLKAKADQLK